MGAARAMKFRGASGIAAVAKAAAVAGLCAATLVATGCENKANKAGSSAAGGGKHANAKDASPSGTDIARVMNSDVDVLGEAALKQKGGPSYEYFRDLMPPLRYVDANFHVYPITMSAPGNTTKARFVSDGSAVNALARTPNWRGEAGRPVTFYVGDARERFGSDLGRLDGPTFVDGYRPVVQVSYTAGGSTFAEEAFCATDKELADYGVVFVKLTLTASNVKHYVKPRGEAEREPAATAPVPGVENATNLSVMEKAYDDKVEASVEGPEMMALKDRRLTGPDGKVVAIVHPQWAINPGRNALIAPLKVGESAYIAIFTKPADPSMALKLTPETYEGQRQACIGTWDDLLNKGMTVTTPEKVVNDAWRAALAMNFELLHGDEMRYSQGNAYAKMYIAEGGDATRCAALWGHADAAGRMMTPLFHYTRKGLEYHQAALKLQMLAHYYRLTRDLDLVRSMRPLWQKEIDVILNGREKDTGMLPREKYAGDVATLVYSANSNSNCWRALRDMSAVLADVGDAEQSQRLAVTAAEYRKVILATFDKAIRRDVDPPFVPVALSGEENPHDPIWATTMGSYWNLMIEYVLGSGVFPADSEKATDIIHYLQRRGGLCMGILRARATPGNFWVEGPRLNDLYGTRYVLALLERDEADRALVSFYGKLAQGMTRDTFIGCEGSSMGAVDQYGRQMYLPPNSAANSNYLTQLRYILVQDWDRDDDGKPETLRLAFATPRKWLEDGKEISVQNAPTAFGPVSYVLRSRLKSGQVVAEIELPERAPQSALLRLRLPEGWKVNGATAGKQRLNVVDRSMIDLSGLQGRQTVTVKVGR